MDVPIPRVRLYLGGDPLDPTRAHFRAHRCKNRRCFSSSRFENKLWKSGLYSQERILVGQIADFPIPQVVEEIVEEIL